MPPEFRLYRLIQITGWTLDQIDDAPSDTLDWLLRIDVTVQEIEAEMKAKQQRASR